MGYVVLTRIDMTAAVAVALLMFPVTPCLGGEEDRTGPPARYALTDVTITLEQPACGLGLCQSYAVSIHGDGRVVYEGREHVATIGRREAKIESERVLELLKHFYHVGFFHMHDEYKYGHTVSIWKGMVVETRYYVTDAPATTLSVTINGYQKRIVWVPEISPKDLLTLPPRVVEAAGIGGWLK